MKCKKVFSFFAVSAVVLSLLAFSAGQAQGLTFPGLYSTYIPGPMMPPPTIIDEIYPDFVVKIASSILSNNRVGIVNFRQISGMDYDGNTLRFGEAYRHTWKFLDEDGNIEYAEAKEWKLSYTNGEAKFVLVLNDDQKQEFPIEELDREDDLKYLFEYLVDKLDKISELSGKNIITVRDVLGKITYLINDNKQRQSLRVSINSIDTELSRTAAELSKNVEEIQAQLGKITHQLAPKKSALQLSFRHINNVFSLVSIGLMTIKPGTEAGQELKLTIGGETLTFRWCPSGEFTRQVVVGQQTAEKEESYARDRYGRRIKLRTPRTTTVTEDVKGEQRVTLSKGFWILDSEVTRQIYQRVTATRMRGTLSNPQYPLTNATWSDADKFCEELNKITQKNFTLPTEAQWQYACRANGGTVDLDLVAWYRANSGSKGRPNRLRYPYHEQHDVKTKEPNAWGIYDMLGNVSEWCADWDGTETPAETAVDPTGPETGEKRVVCGGNFTSPAENCVFDYTVGNLPNQKVGTIGFRVILIPDPPKEDTMSETADEGIAEETDNLNGFESTDDNAEAPKNVDAEDGAETETVPETDNTDPVSNPSDTGETKDINEGFESESRERENETALLENQNLTKPAIHHSWVCGFAMANQPEPIWKVLAKDFTDTAKRYVKILSQINSD